MAQLLTEERATVTWYSNPPLTIAETGLYERYKNLIKGRWNGKVLITGCGIGYTVDLLIKDGLDAWGCDASAYAINTSKAMFPTIADRFILADCLNQNQMDDVRRAAGLTVSNNQGRNQKFNVVVTEDMLGCLTDAEIAVCLPLMRRTGSIVAHIVSVKPNDMTNADPTLNWKTLAEWKTVVGNDYLVTGNGEVYE